MKKRILSILLVACMLLAVIPMTVSAEEIKPTPTTPTYTAPTAPAGTTTVYVGGTNASDTDGDGTENKPYASLEKAYAAIINNSNFETPTNNRKIVVNGTVNVQSTTPSASGTAHLILGQYTAGTIYICGKDGTSPTIDCSGSGGYVITLGADTVFDNICFKNTTSTSGNNIWFAAALYDLTFGNNITSTTSSKHGLLVTGTAWDKTRYSNGENVDSSDSQATISIYSGNFLNVFLGARATDVGTISGTMTLNIFGGSFGVNSDGTKKDHKTEGRIDIANNGVYSNCKMNVNIYDCDYMYHISSTISSTDEITATLTYFNGCRSKVETFMSNTNLTYAGGYTGIFKDGANTKDSLYVGVQNTAVTSDKYSVRFVAVIGGELESYTKLGFDVTVNGTNADYSKECRNVYTSIAGKDDTTTYTAEQFGGDYIFALAIKDIPISEGTVTFTVTPYVIKKGEDTKTLGASYTVTYNAGEYDSSAVAAN